ncbi:hypothetical protein HBA55_34830 [Pseudomaricurvus alkylphenolicus]|uniref:hypothetical protein n=1 Tax=Pseudomaricurvus alkylphenolicus TaxID=1306991 RepID=UPI0014221934|nr:hypothetical protein [Pseudomaricurvus alkylphenolicus]NIB44808.1 hypothetical protein [Pseudomaricurvus alkylphenolicus]
MKIVRNKQTKVAVYLFEDNDVVELGELLRGPGVSASDISSDDYEIAVGPAPAQWAGRALAYDSGWTVVDQELLDVELAHQMQEQQSQAEANAAKLVNRRLSIRQTIVQRAEQERLKYITPGYGKAMVYTAKHEEAKRLASDAAPSAADYPLLAAEVGITASDLAGVGQSVLNTAGAWLAVAAQIEKNEKVLLVALDNAVTLEEVDGVDVNAGWPAAS